MTGKELVLVLGGATVFGAVAGIAAATLSPSAPAPSPVRPRTDDSVLARLDRLEADLGSVRAERDELRAAVDRLRQDAVDRATAGTTPVTGDLRFETQADPDGNPFAARGEDAMKQLEAALAKMGVDGDARIRFGTGEPGTGAVWTTDGEPAPEALSRLQEHMQGLRKGLELRLLPEDERWARAREDLSLSPSQEENLKQALADRDRDLEQAFVTEKDEVDGAGGRLQVRRVDPTLARQANENFRSRVDATLATDQRDRWDSGGYDHAFGETPFGGGSGTTVMAVQTHTTTTINEASDSSSSSEDE